MENDIKQKKYNQLLNVKEEKTESNIRTKFVMSLVYLIRGIENTEDKILKRYFYDVIEQAKLNDKERQLFEFESNNKGV